MTKRTEIYLDNAATAPMLPRLASAFRHRLNHIYGNPSSQHRAGVAARMRIESTRETLAEAIGANPDELVFTSGGTEANNTALIFGEKKGSNKHNHIIISRIEHQSILAAGKRLAAAGCDVTLLPVKKNGVVEPRRILEALRDTTTLVSIMLVNNEVGTIQPIADISQFLRKRRILFHTDAVQALGKLPFRVDDLGADMISLSAHKIHGPMGVGALYLRSGIGHPTRGGSFSPLIVGGHQEQGRRAGTENLWGIIGFELALVHAFADLPRRIKKIATIRDGFETMMKSAVPSVIINARSSPRVCSISNMSFPSVKVDGLINSLSDAGVFVSAGSACASTDLQPSHVLTALGVSAALAQSSIRFSFSDGSTQRMASLAVKRVKKIIDRLRA